MFQKLPWPFTIRINCSSDLKCQPIQPPASIFKKKISIPKTILSHRRSEQFGKQNIKSNLTEKISLKIKQKLNAAGCIEGKLANDFQYTHNPNGNRKSFPDFRWQKISPTLYLLLPIPFLISLTLYFFGLYTNKHKLKKIYTVAAHLTAALC